MNLLLIPVLEDAGYNVSTHSDRDREVITSKGGVIVFKCDTEICKGMSYIDLRKDQQGYFTTETIQKNLKEFLKTELERVEIARAVERQIGHPIKEHLKNIVSQQSLKNTPIRSTDVANARVVFGLSAAGLKGWSSRNKIRGFPIRKGVNTKLILQVEQVLDDSC